MRTDTIQLAVDGLHGHYIPQRFFQLYPQFLDHLNEEDHAVIKDPEHEHYYEVWDHFVTHFEVVKDNVRWFLYCDDDVFFVSEHHTFND